MGLRDRFQRKVTLSTLQLQCTIVVTLLSTVFLFTVWPRFRNDALSLDWWVYLILISLVAMPLFKRN
jgi:hypothetical protein